MSARAMPKTGNPHIDAKVAKAKKQPKDEREKRNAKKTFGAIKKLVRSSWLYFNIPL